MSLAPSLAEQWFVDDNLLWLEGLCPECRAAFRGELRLFAATDRDALSEVFRQSRAIRVQAALAGRGYRRDDYESLHVHRTLRALISMASGVRS